MRAMTLYAPGEPLRLVERDAELQPGADEVLIRVAACGVCRTDLHIVDGELPAPKLPLIPGHEIVGTVAAHGLRRADASRRRARRRALAGLDLRRLPLLPRAAGRTCATTPASPATRSTAASPSTPWPTSATAFRVPGGYSDVRGRASALRRTDRLPRPTAWPATPSGSASTASARRPTSSRRSRAIRDARLRLHQARRRQRPGVRPPPRRGLGRRLGRASARTAGRGHHLRARRRAGARRPRGQRTRAAWWSAAAST